MTHTIVKFAVLTLGAAGLWILLVSGVKPEEMVVMAVCAPLTIWFTWYVALQCRLHVDLRSVDLLQIRYIPVYLCIGIWEIVSVLSLDLLRIRPAESLYRAAPFEAAHRGAIGTGRRVLAIVYTTATPNFIILGITPDTHWMLFYQIVRSEIPTMTRHLGAHA